MKKLIILFLILIVPFVLVGCGPKEYDEIKYNKLKQMIENKEDFVLMLGATSCSACIAYKPTLNKVISDYRLDIKYLDLDKLSEKETAYVMSNFNISGTPTIIFVKKGKEKDIHNRIVGNEKYSETVERFKENGYIKE